ncbi:MAG: hypothetical protein K0T99_00395 [Alphaproteobacteria bacterium]|nr:hypothetical protein [Alphaproteobacteria bacterium]
MGRGPSKKQKMIAGAKKAKAEGRAKKLLAAIRGEEKAEQEEAQAEEAAPAACVAQPTEEQKSTEEGGITEKERLERMIRKAGLNPLLSDWVKDAKIRLKELESQEEAAQAAEVDPDHGVTTVTEVGLGEFLEEFFGEEGREAAQAACAGASTLQQA